MVAGVSLDMRSAAQQLKPHAIDIRVNIDLKNSYRVLLTRARQGMLIFSPPGTKRDRTRRPGFYDGVCHYLTGMVVVEI
jgi:hypothetical protein